MYIEKVIMDERLDASANYVEELVTQYFIHHIVYPLDLDVTWEQHGNKKVWVVKPEDRSDGQPEELVNGYIEISSISLNRDLAPSQVRVVTCREELTFLWHDLSQYMKISILAPQLPPRFIATSLTKQMALSVERQFQDSSSPSTVSVNVNPCDALLPQTQEARKRWKKAFDIIVGRRDEYLEEYQDSLSKKSKGTLADFQDAIAQEMKWRIGERTLRKIIKAGDTGCFANLK